MLLGMKCVFKQDLQIFGFKLNRHEYFSLTWINCVLLVSLWKDVTYHLKLKDVENATDGKHRLEQRQRQEAKERKELGTKWDTKVKHCTVMLCKAKRQ